MPLDVPNDCRSSFSCRREKRSVTSPSVQDFIAGLRDEKSRQHDSRNAAMGVALVKFTHEFANELNFVSGAIQFLENDIEQPHQAQKHAATRQERNPAPWLFIERTSHSCTATEIEPSANPAGFGDQRTPGDRRAALRGKPHSS